MNTIGRPHQRITQDDGWSCFAAVAAMVTGETIADVHAFVGHDGSAQDAEAQPNHPEHRVAFSDWEIYRYLVDRGFALGWPYHLPKHWAYEQHEEHPFLARAAFLRSGGLRIEQPLTPAVLTVASERFEGCRHAVYFDGSVVWDPNPGAASERPLSDYTVYEYWPVIVLPGGPADTEAS